MAKQQSMEDVLKDLRKTYGVRIGTFSEVVKPVVGMTTGHFVIDNLSGVVGLPQGRITELVGQPSSGKTTSALQTAAAFQKKIILAGNTDDHVLYVDFEQTLDKTYAQSLGLDTDHPQFILAQPHWLEDGAEIALKLIAAGGIRLCIWDSVAEMVPKALADGDFDQRTSAMNRARLMNGLLQRLCALSNEQDCAQVFLNHAVEAIQMTGRPGMPPQQTSSGGKALKFYASLRLSFNQVKNITGTGIDPLSGLPTKQVVATLVKVKAIKNKVGPPFRQCEVRVRLGRGFDEFWSAIQVLLAYKQVILRGSNYCFDYDKVPTLTHSAMTDGGATDHKAADGPRLFGEPALLRFADQHMDWRARVIAEARRLVEEQDSTAPIVEEDFDLSNLLSDD